MPAMQANGWRGRAAPGIVGAAMLLVAGCSSGGDETTATTTPLIDVKIVLADIAGQVITNPSFECNLAQPRVTVADDQGTTVAVATLPNDPGEINRDQGTPYCITQPATVQVPESDFYTFTLVGDRWSATGDFSADEVERGLVVETLPQGIITANSSRSSTTDPEAGPTVPGAPVFHEPVRRSSGSTEQLSRPVRIGGRSTLIPRFRPGERSMSLPMTLRSGRRSTPRP